MWNTKNAEQLEQNHYSVEDSLLIVNIQDAGIHGTRGNGSYRHHAFHRLQIKTLGTAKWESFIFR